MCLAKAEALPTLAAIRVVAPIDRDGLPRCVRGEDAVDSTRYHGPRTMNIGRNTST